MCLRAIKTKHYSYSAYLSSVSWAIYNINTKNCSLSIVLTATDQKPQKSLKGHITQHHVDIQAI